jgi:hypothetical protein
MKTREEAHLTHFFSKYDKTLNLPEQQRLTVTFRYRSRVMYPDLLTLL